ncbi:integrase core domain-containing protein [Gilliamella apis]|uniref:integrase core domain-containing protein n=1 Tax=Gilliamella apis TaxID=1970738 RepID=UPI001055D7CA|nr:integrase core domain-containing protein [Gilliamella apis]
MPQRYPEPLSVPSGLGECWSMDFMSNSSQNHRRFRTFNVIDDFNREALGIDNDAEFTSNRFTSWAKSHGITLDYIKPGSPYQNGYIERFNRTYRTEVLDLYVFKNLEQARKITEEWLEMCITVRPHEALNNMTPIEYRKMKQIA